MTIYEEAQAPKVTGSPAAIWLVYGDIERDCTHAECAEVTWCEDQQHPSDVRYVRADTAEAMVAEIARLRSALAASCDEHRAEVYDTTTGGGCPVLAAERERCAKLCDDIHARHIAEHGDYIGETSYAAECARAIRA